MDPETNVTSDYCRLGRIALSGVLLSVLAMIACAAVWCVFRSKLPNCSKLDLAAFAMVVLAGVAISGLLAYFATKWHELSNR